MLLSLLDGGLWVTIDPKYKKREGVRDPEYFSVLRSDFFKCLIKIR